MQDRKKNPPHVLPPKERKSVCTVHQPGDPRQEMMLQSSDGGAMPSMVTRRRPGSSTQCGSANLQHIRPPYGPFPRCNAKSESDLRAKQQ